VSDDALFPVPDGARVDAPQRMTPDRSLCSRQLKLITHGMHPISLVNGAGCVFLHPDAPRSDDKTAAGPRCGTCVFRVREHYHRRDYAKCEWPDRPGRYPRMSHSNAGDVPAWWPACREYEPKTETA
jgi:hypothetical protein